MRKKLLIENELSELDDFQKILLLNKKKIDIDDIEFVDSDGERYDDIIEYTNDGIIFHFDDLEGYLRFFFKDTYGEEGSEGYYDAINYDRMYYNSYDYSDNCYDRMQEDFQEGYVIGGMCPEAIGKLKELLKFISPYLSNTIKVIDGKYSLRNANTEEISRLLKRVLTYDIESELSDINCDARSRMLHKLIPETIDETYCNGLSKIGIENWSKHCFQTYFISWSRIINMYISGRGIFDEKMLDVFFDFIERDKSIRHLTYAYELEYEVWDNKVYEEYSCNDYVDQLQKYIESFIDNPLNNEYSKIINRLSAFGLFTPRKIVGNDHLYIQVTGVDEVTHKVLYKISNTSYMANPKYGSAPVDEVIAITTQRGFFNPLEYRREGLPRK